MCNLFFSAFSHSSSFYLIYVYASRSIDDELERGKSPFWWTSEELRLMKIDNLVEMCDETAKGGWQHAPEEDDMLKCTNCERPIHPVHMVEFASDVNMVVEVRKQTIQYNTEREILGKKSESEHLCTTLF
jgi:hypothetical protein